jgi:dsRNA-specific ribonuclease
MCEVTEAAGRVEGRGHSRRQAEQNAAEQMLLILNRDDNR